MSLCRFNLCGVAVVVLMVFGGFAVVGRAQVPATQPAAGGANSDIEIGKPSKNAFVITPLLERGVLRDNHNGPPLLTLEFVFNPMTHELGLARNSAGDQLIYGGSRIDAAQYDSELSIFDYVTTDRTAIGKIVLTCAKKKIAITHNYVVSLAYDKPAPIDPSSYRAFVQFVKGDECNKPGTTVTVRRNADPPTALADAEFSKISRKTDVITWTVERGGAVVKTGSFGFPVVATEPDLVKYVVQLP